MKDKLSKLLSVKSIVTLILTLVFAFLACTRQVTPQQFIEIFAVIIAFYFGTQYQKKEEAISENEQKSIAEKSNTPTE